jgi:hypothetical protein
MKTMRWMMLGVAALAVVALLALSGVAADEGEGQSLVSKAPTVAPESAPASGPASKPAKKPGKEGVGEGKAPKGEGEGSAPKAPKAPKGGEG